MSNEVEIAKLYNELSEVKFELKTEIRELDSQLLKVTSKVDALSDVNSEALEVLEARITKFEDTQRKLILQLAILLIPLLFLMVTYLYVSRWQVLK